MKIDYLLQKLKLIEKKVGSFIKIALKPILILWGLFLFCLWMMVLCSSCSEWKIEDIPPDSVPEEIVEELIKARYKVDLDLSPNTPEQPHDPAS